MPHSSLEVRSEGEALSSAMRAIRRRRGLTAAEVAQAMGMPLRTFEEFEAGRGPLTHDRIFAFADATDSDPFALLLCGLLKAPDLALDSADTKLVMIMMMHLEEFVEHHGGDIGYLEPPNIIGAFERVFKDLSARLEDREQFMQKWLEQRTGSIGLTALRRRGVKRRPERGRS